MQPLRVLDLFCGAGGSSFGARSAGACVVAGVDAWETATQTYSDNFAPAKGLNYTLSGESVDARIRTLGKVDVLLASPECTNHTCARGARPKCEESQMTAWQVLHHARALEPNWIVIENVVQMRSWKKFSEFEKELLAMDYNLWPFVLDASDYGVPQSRRRFFLVCSREDKAFTMEAPNKERRDVRSILDERGKWAVTPLARPGRAAATLARAEVAFEAIGRKEPFLLVYYGSDSAGGWQPLDRPLRTMTTLDRFALVEPGPKGHTMRMLQVPELRRAMGFPDSFNLSRGTRRDQVKLLGNGVCPPVMEHIVTNIANATAGIRARAPRQLTLIQGQKQAANG